MEKETTYNRILVFAENVPALLNLSGKVADTHISRALGIPHRTFQVWKNTDFESIKRSDINTILKLLNCRYEDVFL
jgi:DNA-binding Xre family transcriptional regulator